jgi:hypothetical protein
MPQRDKRIYPLYYALMYEAKGRIRSVEMIADGRTAFFSPMTARKSCFLQLRMLCELIALGCVAAHENRLTAKLRGLDEPHKIFAELERLNPNYFPQPVKLTILGPRFSMEPLENGSLTKSELVGLRDRSGNDLHAGDVKRRMAKQPEARTDFADILEWLDKIKLLLSSHRIDRGDGVNFFACEIFVPLRNEFDRKYSPYQDGGLILLEGHKHR